MDYDDRHRTFLQAVMHQGSIKEDDAVALCCKIFKQKMKVSVVSDKINDKLAPIAMALKSGICEITGERYWTTVGTTHEESLMMPSEFSVAQRAFLRSIYEEIINSEDGCISSTVCLNLHHTIDTKLSIDDANKFLKHVINKKWLHSKDGFIYIGVRSIVELMPYFRATYVDNFHNCSLCHQVLFYGEKCPNCDKMYHTYCLNKYANMLKEKKCPKCKRMWPNNDEDEPQDGSREEEEEEEEEGGETDIEDKENEDMNISDNEVEVSQPEAISKAKKRRRSYKN